MAPGEPDLVSLFLEGLGDGCRLTDMSPRLCHLSDRRVGPSSPLHARGARRRRPGLLIHVTVIIPKAAQGLEEVGWRPPAGVLLLLRCLRVLAAVILARRPHHDGGDRSNVRAVSGRQLRPNHVLARKWAGCPKRQLFRWPNLTILVNLGHVQAAHLAPGKPWPMEWKYSHRTGTMSGARRTLDPDCAAAIDGILPPRTCLPPLPSLRGPDSLHYHDAGRLQVAVLAMIALQPAPAS